MKMHISTDDSVGCIHSVDTTSANGHDITAVDKLLHGEEKRAWGDAGYVDIDQYEEHQNRQAEWLIIRAS